MYHSTRALRRPSVATIIATIALTASFVIAGAGTVNAQSNKNGLVGSWLETVTFPPELGWPPAQVSRQLSRRRNHGRKRSGWRHHRNRRRYYSSCHGVWTHLNQRTFAYTVSI